MAKKNNSFIVGILGALACLMVLGAVTRGFEEWDVSKWFGDNSSSTGDDESTSNVGDSELPSVSSKVPVNTDGQIFKNIDLNFDIANGSVFNYTRGAYMYQNSSYFENSTINCIGLPVKSLTDYTKENVFTIYVCDFNSAKNKGTEFISEHTLTIPANTYNSNNINDWVYFETHIEVGTGQTLAFLKDTDTIKCTYPSTTLTEYKFYIDVFDGESLVASSGNILFDVYKEV